MKKWIVPVLLALLLTGCAGTADKREENVLMTITAQEAKMIMDKESGYVILDVRTQQEYEAAHIPGAVLIPDYEIAERAESVLQDKSQLILVYCRSGRRSANAAAQLAAMGYTQIRDFGGIINWPYDTE